MDSQTTQKIQPWKAGWFARNAVGVHSKLPMGTSYDAKKGEDIISGGYTSGVAIKMPGQTKSGEVIKTPEQN